MEAKFGTRGIKYLTKMDYIKYVITQEIYLNNIEQEKENIKINFF